MCDAAKDAYNSAKGLGEACSKGADAGRAAFRTGKEKTNKENEETLENAFETQGNTAPDKNASSAIKSKNENPENVVNSGTTSVTEKIPKNIALNAHFGNSAVVGAKSVTGMEQPPAVKLVSLHQKGTGQNHLIASNSGSVSAKSITMNVTLNITNNGMKNPDEFTEQVVRKINERINDSLTAS